MKDGIIFLGELLTIPMRVASQFTHAGFRDHALGGNNESQLCDQRNISTEYTHFYGGWYTEKYIGLRGRGCFKHAVWSGYLCRRFRLKCTQNQASYCLTATCVLSLRLRRIEKGAYRPGALYDTHSMKHW